MRWIVSIGALLTGALSVVSTGSLPADAADTGPSEVPAVAPALAVTVELDRDAASVSPGDKVRFVSTVANTGGRPFSGLVAHLSILSSDSHVYVDPEDWSPLRTQYIDDLGTDAQDTLQWEVRAVTSGPMILYVGVTNPDTGEVATSGTLSMTVSGKREFQAAGAIPLIVGMPALVVVLLGLVGIRSRRHQ